MNPVQQNLQRGVRFHRSGDLNSAERLYRAVLSKLPNQPDALHLLGVLTMQRGKPATAANLIKRATSLNSRNGLYFGDFGEALYRCGKRDAAIQACLRSIELSPENAKAHSTIGKALRDNGKRGEALDHFRESIKLQPRFAEGFFHIGQMVAAEGRLEEAIEHLQTAADLDPTSMNARLILGSTQQKLGKLEEAISSFKFVVDRQPRFIEASINLGLAYNDDGNRVEAKRCFSKILEFDPENARAHCHIGLIGILDRDLEESVASFKKALKINPNHASALYGLGSASEESGDAERAIQHYEQALQIDPKLSSARHYLEIAKSIIDVTPAQVERLKAAHSLNDSSFRINFEYGVALWKSGKDDEAEKLLRKATAGNPESPEAQYYLSRALHSAGKSGEAVGHLQRALELEPENLTYRTAEATHSIEHGPESESKVKRIALHLRQVHHFRTLSPIFEKIPRHHHILFTPHIRELLDFDPDVAVVSESQAALLRSRLPKAVLVWTPHQLTSKNTACSAARVSDYACLTSEENREWYTRHGGTPRMGFWLTGHVQMDPLFREESPVLPFSLPEEGKTVIYGPTWNEFLTSAPLLGKRAVELIRGEETNISIIIKPHPLIFERQPNWVQNWRELQRNHENVHFVDDPAADIVPYLKAADLLVSDASSVIFQFLALNRPIILINNPNRFGTAHFDPKGIEWQWRDLADTMERVEDLPGAVARNLGGGDTRREYRSRYRKRLFGSLTDGRAAERIAAKIDQLPV